MSKGGEYIGKIKKKLADARRDKYYRKGQLPWQLEGLNRGQKQYVEISEAKSLAFFVSQLNDETISILREIVKKCKPKGIECLIITNIPQEEEHLLVPKLPTDFKIYPILDGDITDTGEVKGVYIQRLYAKLWDLVIVNSDEKEIGIDYLLHLAKAKCIISDTESPYTYPDVQYKTSKTDKYNLLTLVLEKINSKK